MGLGIPPEFAEKDTVHLLLIREDAEDVPYKLLDFLLPVSITWLRVVDAHVVEREADGDLCGMVWTDADCLAQGHR